METVKEKHIGLQLVALTAARLLINTGVRVIYPFTPALARGLGVGTADITRLITIRNATGFLSPLFGPLSERFGRKVVMASSMLLFGLSCLLVFIWPEYWVLGLTLALIGLVKIIYDPAMQAYLGDTVPYKKRGKAIAVTEYAWSLALLIGAPAVAFAVQAWGWKSPFLWLGILGLGSIVFLLRMLPNTKPGHQRRVTFSRTLHFMQEHPIVIFAFIYMALVTLANEMLFIVFATWMEGSFQLNLAGLGIAAAIIGGAEIVGETFAGWSVDQFGKRKVIITAGICNALAYLLMPFVSGSLQMALIMLFVVFLSFEITVVGGMPLMTELVPDARAIVMSLVIAASALGRTLGAFLGLLVWNWVGFQLSGMIWGLIMAVAVVILILFIHEEGQGPESK